MADIKWKSKEEIEADKNQPKPKTELELLKEELQTTQEALNFLIMNGGV